MRHCPRFTGCLYKPVSCLRVERIMTLTPMMAPPPKKIDICTMILFQGELAASTEVSLAPRTNASLLSPSLHLQPTPHTLHFTALASGQCHSHLHCHLRTLLLASGPSVLLQVLEASDLDSLISLPSDLPTSKVTIKTVPGMIPLKLCSDHPIHSFE